MSDVRQHADIVWEGTIARGVGEVSGGSGVLDVRVDLPTRLGEAEGRTTPEELLAAAHAACFTMALGSILAREKTPPERLQVRATVTLDNTEGQRALTGIHLDARGAVPDADVEAFRAAVAQAEKMCVVSRALSVPITSEATLE